MVFDYRTATLGERMGHVYSISKDYHLLATERLSSTIVYLIWHFCIHMGHGLQMSRFAAYFELCGSNAKTRS
jgi:hypothetical protein